jgi:hypothetical protein
MKSILGVGSVQDVVVSSDLKNYICLKLEQIGTIGILIRATKASLFSVKESVELLDELVKEHNFRISIRVFKPEHRHLKPQVPYTLPPDHLNFAFSTLK